MRHTTLHGAYEIADMPGQPQLALCHSLFVVEHARGQGHGRALKQHQGQVLMQQHYDFALCTVAGNNARQQAVLRHAGWAPMAAFPNSRLGGETLIYGFDVAAARQRAVAALEPNPEVL